MRSLRTFILNVIFIFIYVLLPGYRFFRFLKEGENIFLNYINKLPLKLIQNSEAVCVDEPTSYVFLIKNPQFP